MWISIEQSDTPQGVGPSTTGCFIQEEKISNLVQFLRAGPCRHVIGGIIQGILEELSKFNIDSILQVIGVYRHHNHTNLWRRHIALDYILHHSGKQCMCRPITYEPSVNEKNVKWEAKLKRLKKLEQKESYIRHRVMKLRVNRDGLILELHKKTAITINRNGSMVQEIQHQEATLDGMMKELKEVASQRRDVSDRFNRLRQSVVLSASDRLQREINAHAVYRYLCTTLKSGEAGGAYTVSSDGL